MLKTLLKKQLIDMNRGFFQNRKTGKSRSRIGSILYIALFGFLVVGVLGGIFTLMAISMCKPLMEAGMDWMYFLLISGIAAALGLFGSVFSTYSGLYLAKDNDLLLSMPIPISAILASRLLGVYLMDLLFVAVVMVPAIVVYAVNGAAILNVLCAVAFTLALSLLVLCLSCALGWVVAKLGSRVKKKSAVTTVLSLLCFAVYYLFYSRAQQAVKNIIENSAAYGAKVENDVYPLYLLGRAASGDGLALLAFAAIVTALLALVWWLIQRSFIRLATVQVGSKKKKLRDAALKQKSVNAALFGKERARFLSSAGYMLNCGFGVIFTVLAGVAALIKGHDLAQVLDALSVSGVDTGVVPLIAAGLICLLTSANNIAAASVSLEGRTLWIVRSLPVAEWSVLRAKLRLHVVITVIPGVFCALCMAYAVKASAALAALFVLLAIVFSLFSASFGLMLDLKRPMLGWTNETAAVKQNISVLFALLGGWACVGLFVAAWFLLPVRFAPVTFLLLVLIVMSLLTAGLLIWIKKRGTKIFAAL